MKHFFAFVAIMLLAVSCTAPLSTRLSRLADKVEKKGMEFSSAEWDKVSSEFEVLIKEYYDNYDSYSSAEKSEINEAIGRVSAAAVKCGAKGVASVAASVLEEYPMINGLLQGAKGFFDSLFE